MVQVNIREIVMLKCKTKTLKNMRDDTAFNTNDSHAERNEASSKKIEKSFELKLLNGRM
jgi:hypothetical protein